MPAPLPDRLPIDPHTGQPQPPRMQPGYYPGYSTLGQQDYWDAATRAVVLDRVLNVPPIRFFTPAEERLMRAVCDRLLPQDDRDEARRIPIVAVIDERLYSGRIDGYRYEDMPSDDEAIRLGLQGIEAIAQHLHGTSFLELEPIQQDQALKTIHDGEPAGNHEIWQRLSPKHFWSLLLGDVIEAYYAHPWAWDEIGFGGPAYPRGYMRQERGQPEPWEVDERRYEWAPPPTSLSGYDTPLGGAHPHKNQPTAGQEGTH